MSYTSHNVVSCNVTSSTGNLKTRVMSYIALWHLTRDTPVKISLCTTPSNYVSVQLTETLTSWKSWAVLEIV